MNARSRFVLILLVLALLIAITAATAVAQDENVIASGLINPRHVAYGGDGTLYIVESGTGGDIEIPGPGDRPITFGGTGRVSVVDPSGQQSVLLGGLTSTNGGQRGAMGVLPTEDALWLTLGEAPVAAPFSNGVVELDRATLRVRRFIDFYTPESEQNPDGDVVLTNPADLALSADGVLYITDASGNALWRWTADAGLELVTAWPLEDGQAAAVPTSVALGAEGDLYVGFLTGFPFTPQGARVEHWSAAGELVETFEGLTYVTDVLVAADGSLYAVEMANAFGDTGFAANTGRVVKVSADGLTPVAEGLNFPYGLAQAPDGSLVVTVNSHFSEPGSGMVIRLAM